ncbi:hypothetical protein G7Z17_g2564 [Cylindrodendrum hubeiense]|uniref:Uncharacterized protein n=1 Tax=Cylindrodendrum hubeiense TaxID=595255 RepID=A0A9P5HCJ7_9HYPO|nr:hypothetical protein G7Z17_g2564 [Cylindrodendrum hubeiense]
MAGIKRPVEAMLGHEGAPSLARCRNSISNTQIHSVTMGGSTITDRLSAATQAEPQPVAARTPTSTPALPVLTRKPLPEFSSDASLVLVGIRGAGKSTLAIMASSVTNRKVIDLETAFHSASGTTSADYKTKHGSAACDTQQAKVLNNLLHRHSTGCVLVCSWISSTIQSLLQKFSETHPVIHIVREADAIEKLFNISDKGKVWDLLRLSSAIFRTYVAEEELVQLYLNLIQHATRLAPEMITAH